MLCCTWFVMYYAVLYMYCDVFLKSCSAASGHIGPRLPAGCLSTATRAGYGWLAANGNCNLLRWQQSYPRSEQHAHWPVMPEKQHYILLKDMWVLWISLDLDLDSYIAGTIIYLLGERDANLFLYFKRAVCTDCYCTDLIRNWLMLLVFSFQLCLLTWVQT